MLRNGLAVLFVSLCAIFCVAQQANVLSVGMFTDPPSVDPALVSSYEEYIVTANTYETLLKYDLNTWEVVPLLAQAWAVSEDATRATFYLREGVTFHDGTDFDAEAVRFSLERALAIGRAPSAYLSRIKSFEVVGPYEIQMTTDRPWAFWEDVFACVNALPIVSPSYVKANATAADPWATEWMRQHTCGTGAYMLAEWRQGEYVRLERFAGYWRGWTERNFETVMVMIVREPAKQKLYFERGAIDISFGIPVSEYPKLEANPGVIVVPVTGLAQRYITMKADRPPLDDVNVRRAIAYAIQYENLPTIRPYARIAQGPLPHHALGFNDSIEVSHRDIDKARQLLSEAGYKPGDLQLELVYVAGLDFQRDLAVMVQANLAEIGIKLTLRSMPWATLFPLLSDPEKSPAMYVFFSAARFGDPHGILWEMFHPDALGLAGFNNGYRNAVVGDLLDQAERETDRDHRADLYREVSRIIAEDQPAVFLWEEPYPQIYRSDLRNIAPDGLFRTYYFYEIYREN